MKISILIYLCSFHLVLSQTGGASQCINAEPLCGAAEFSYSNVFGVVWPESGPDYGCLDVRYNPSWFYLQIDKPGDIELKIEQSTVKGGPPNLDVDFILYGPFDDPTSPCIDDLTAAHIVDCSYEPDAVEYVTIDNTLAGEYYLLLITNFDLQPGYITVTQTAGAATTNCNIVADDFACSGDAYTLDATTNGASTYVWYESVPVYSNNYKIINGANAAKLDVFQSNTYKVEAYDDFNNLVQTLFFNIAFFEKPLLPEHIQDYEICDVEGDNDGIATFDLEKKSPQILNGLNPANYKVSYYESIEKANDGIDSLPLKFTNAFVNQPIYARVDNISSGETNCYSVTSFILKAHMLPEPVLEPYYIICNSPTNTIFPSIVTQFSESAYTFKWFHDNLEVIGETQSAIEATNIGGYRVEVTHIETTCVGEAKTLVYLNEEPQLKAEVISSPFERNHKVEAWVINEKASQEYEFRLDKGGWQSEGVFTNVPFGEHQIEVRDVAGCGIDVVTVMAVGFPRFFTPNNDLQNEVWNVSGMGSEYKGIVSIFDRYGKLLKQIRATDMGWNGTYNGVNMPSGDYWFKINYIEPRSGMAKQYLDHFALKR